MIDLYECKIKDFDTIYYATKESQGTSNTIKAIQYVLFQDQTIFQGRTPLANKYLYISSTNGACRKAMLLQQDDLAHILVKYCMQSFGLRNKPFTITEEDFYSMRIQVEHAEISPYEMIEMVSYATMEDVYLAYTILYTNNKVLNAVLLYMIQERYMQELKDILDQFNGMIDNKQMETEQRYKFYDAFTRLDESFAEIKRNNKDYIK